MMFNLIIRLSIAASFVSVVLLPVYWMLRRLHKRRVGGRLVPLLLLFAAVWFLRFGENLYNCSLEENTALTGLLFWEQLADAALHGLQSFSMNEVYSDFHAVGKKMMGWLTGSSAWGIFFSVYSTLLDISAPLFGGAILLDVLADIFPTLEVGMKFWRRKVIFSTLNEGAVALADSILDQECGLFRRPMIVFANAGPDDGDDNRTELRNAAKALGGVCVKKNIGSLKLGGLTALRDRRIVLNDEAEINNLKTLAELYSMKNMRAIRGVRFYVYYQSEQFTSLESGITTKMDSTYREHYERAIARRELKLLRQAAACGKLIGFLPLGTREALLTKLAQKKWEVARTEEQRYAATLPVTEYRLSRWKRLPWNENYKNLLEQLRKDGTEPTEEQILQRLLMAAQEEHRKNASDPERIRKALEREKSALAEEYRQRAESVYLPSVTRIRLFSNLATVLLRKEPLYRPLLSRLEANPAAEPKELNLTILGSGRIATQVLLQASWLGQMYDRLSINVVSEEPEETVRARLDRISPEILRSTGDPELLSVYSSGTAETNPPYFRFRYTCCNVVETNLEMLVFNGTAEDEPFSILDSDYLVVALGDDERNISTADELDRLICARNVREKRGENVETVTIAYSVYNPELNKICRERTTLAGVRMVPFAGLQDTYSADMIFGEASRPYSDLAHRGYQARAREQAFKDGRSRITDSYNYWSMVARTEHLQYRMFAAWRFLQKKEPDYWNKFGDGQLKKEDYECYRDAVGAYPDKLRQDDLDELDDLLTWLEHRRWNAYLRSVGYTACAPDIKKNFALQIHPCLVECTQGLPREPKDRLDETGDYKIYDSPAETDWALVGSILKNM